MSTSTPTPLHDMTDRPMPPPVVPDPAGPRGRAHPTIRPDDSGVVRFLWHANTLYVRRFHDLRLLTPMPLPPRGPAILVCNHTAGLDPILIQSTSPRRIIWMMEKEFYDIPALTWLFRSIDAIPVTRSGRDTSSVRAALRALHEGEILGVFPEGRIENRRELMPFQDGVAQMAAKTGATVYPAYLDGTQRNKPMLQTFLESQTVTLAFGEPLRFDRRSGDREPLPATTARIQAAVQGLMDHYAAFPR